MLRRDGELGGAECAEAVSGLEVALLQLVDELGVGVWLAVAREMDFTVLRDLDPVVDVRACVVVVTIIRLLAVTDYNIDGEDFGPSNKGLMSASTKQPLTLTSSFFVMSPCSYHLSSSAVSSSRPL